MKTKMPLLAVGLVVLTFLAFYPILNAGCTNWDDPAQGLPPLGLQSARAEDSAAGVEHDRRSLGSGQIEPIQVHHLGPRRHEVPHELPLRVVLGVHLRYRPEL